jgi:hypothetical protein
VLKPRFLPEIRPTPFNYPIDILGKWRGKKYSFIQRYRSGFPDNLGEEFSSEYARLDHVEECVKEMRFNLMWHRHTGQWLCLHRAVKLDRALATDRSRTADSAIMSNRQPRFHVDALRWMRR